VLAGLASMALVILFDQPTPVELINKLKLDLYVKDGNYDM
jgi:bifunctional ADP-heptose synthase (sugar kinase/adenylyltransferase)